MGRRSASQGWVATGHQGASCSRQPRLLGLPLNLGESGFWSSIDIASLAETTTIGYEDRGRRRSIRTMPDTSTSAALSIATTLSRLSPLLRSRTLRPAIMTPRALRIKAGRYWRVARTEGRAKASRQGLSRPPRHGTDEA